ncbi:MAG: FAD-dependent oxidoreductase, partial [Chloroflexota bacterium]|nr:FAD-dependent oxidoreductase [Chloroflexota bacterium]
MDAQFPVIVIGGGLAGLTAAAHLAERGMAPLLLEADQAWAGGRLSGGDAETFEHGGRAWSFPSEHGIHALWGGYGNMRATLSRFTTTELQPSEGEEWIHRWRREVRRVEAGTAVRSRWLPAPFHYLQLLFRPRFWTTITPLDFLSLPGFLASMMLTVGFDPILEGVALDGLTMREYFRGWTPNLRATFIGLAKNLLAAPQESISLTGMIAAMRFYTMLRRDTWHPYYLPDDSHSALIAPLMAAIRARGGEVRHGATAESIDSTPTGWRVVVSDQTRRGLRSAEAPFVVLALNAPGAARLLNAPESSTRAEAGKLIFPGALRTTTVRLWFSRSPLSGASGGMFTGDFAFDNFFWLHKMQPAFREWHDASGGSVIELHLYGTAAQHDEPDKLLLIRAADEVQRAFPELRGSYVHHAIRRNSRTHTAFRVPTSESLHVVTPWEGVTACGDWIGYESPSLWMERACTTAIAAANVVLAADGRDGFALVEPPRPEM